MINYDPKHPKGTKYTVSELKSHRDKWYAQAATATPLAISIKPNTSDKAAFEWIINTLPWQTGLDLLKNHDFGNVFQWSSLDGLQQIWNERDNPIRQFIDPVIEGMRADFAHKTGVFLHFLAAYTVPAKSNQDWHKLPREWHGDGDHFDNEWFDKKHTEINRLADDVFKSYSEFVTEGRRRLG